MVKTQPVISARAATSSRLRGLTLAILFLLAAQFLLGMAVNLFVTIPSNHPGANPPAYFSGVFQSVKWAVTSSSSPLWLLLHASLGLVLVVLTLALLISAIISRKSSWIIVASIGFIGTLGAGFNGGSFLNYNEDFSSMLMSVGFILAMFTYSLGLARGK
jgi:heme A synthase